jgi:5-methylcytosine-specific restriction endonuclease McrA
MKLENLLPSKRADALKIGSVRYFTGKPCPHGHVAERYAKDGGCVDCTLLKYRDWARKNPDKKRSAGRGSYAARPEYYRRKARIWARKNRKKQAPRITKWRSENRDKTRRYGHNYRARKVSAPGSCSPEQAAAIRKLQRDRCAYCRIKLNGDGHLDHIVPLSKGGANFPRNLQWLCGPCNSSKQDREPEVHARRLGKLL